LGISLLPLFFLSNILWPKTNGNWSDTLMCGSPASVMIVLDLSKFILHCPVPLYCMKWNLNLTSHEA
jgi:hypothetical protein